MDTGWKEKTMHKPMHKLAANLTLLFAELPFLDRFQAAAAAGFPGVEYHFPYAWEAALLRERLAANGLSQVLFNLPAGDWQGGERGIACDPGRVAEFRTGVALAISYARVLGNRRINCLAGIPPPGSSAAEAHATLVANLRFACREFRTAGLQLLIEAINSRDIPGFFLTTTRQAESIRREVAADNLLLQYDVYHMQIMEGDLAHTIAHHLPHIGHIQLADTPGRHEPGSGEINFRFLFRFLAEKGYQGWLGCEYLPATTTVAGLSWLAEHGLRA